MNDHELLGGNCNYKGFANDEEITRHQISICTRDKPLRLSTNQPGASYLCVYCTRLFISPRALMTHKRSPRCNKNCMQSKESMKVAIRHHIAVSNYRASNPNKTVSSLLEKQRQATAEANMIMEYLSNEVPELFTKEDLEKKFNEQTNA